MEKEIFNLFEVDNIDNSESNVVAESGIAESDNADSIMGADDIESFILYGSEPQKPTELPGNFTGSAEIKAEPVMEIDPELTPTDMLTVIHSEIKRKGIAGHHIDSMNSFNRVGIKQIATKLFTVEGRLKNARDRDEEDRQISEIKFKVEFTDINLYPPTTDRQKGGVAKVLTPNAARLLGLTYSAQMSIDAKISATAIFKDGSMKTREDKIEGFRIASIPCQVGSDLCHTHNCTREKLKELEEDPENPGGYFIIKGHEWTVDNLENITNNMFHVYKNAYMNELARGTFISKPGDAFENSYQIILRYLTNGAITVEVTTGKFDKFDIPFYLLFRAVGVTRDRDIVNHVVYGVENEDAVTTTLLSILDRSFDVPDSKFDSIRKSTNQAEIIAALGLKVMEKANAAAVKKDDNIAKHVNSLILDIIDRFVFPHIGTTPEHRVNKMRFLGHLVNKLLCVYIGVLEPTDRDSYKNKRVFSAGTSMAKTFKTDFNFAIAQVVKRMLIKDLKSTKFSNVLLADTFKNAIKPLDLERMLTQAIVNGNKVITIRKNEITNRISSQILYHKNDLNVKSTMNTINTPNSTASKQNERADEMRRVHTTYLGYIDVSQSADTGEKVGMSKQMACTASICGASSSFILRNILEKDKESIILLDNVQPEQITSEKLAKVFVNGAWIGCCRNYHEVARKYRNLRRHEGIHHLTTIVWEPLVRELYFWTDVGRMMRPLIIVYNNIEEYIQKWRAGDRTVQFKQWIKLTKQHIEKLRTREITMDDLRMERVIEYISPEEQENALIAPNIETLRENSGDVRRIYTHCDIDQAIFGIVSLATPMANHSWAMRVTYYTNHRKQSAGWFALNYPYRIDKNTTLQHYCEYPLVSTFGDSLTYPNGHNTIVALALHTGLTLGPSLCKA